MLLYDPMAGRPGYDGGNMVVETVQRVVILTTHRIVPDSPCLEIYLPSHCDKK